MDTNQIIETLRKETQSNKVWNDLAHVLATRERARHSLTLSGLMQRMKKEGFSHTVAEYRSILELLAKVGVGVLDRDPKGRIRGIKGIKINIQSLGVAVCNKSDSVINFKQRPHYQKVVSKPTAIQPDVQYSKQNTELMITILVNNKPVNIPMPDNLSSKDIADFIGKIHKD